MNVSAACPQCGTIANPNDRFCNTCGTPLQRGAPAPGAQPAAAQQAYAPQPAPAPPYPGAAPQAYPPAPGYGAPPRVARCQLGHDIMPGMSYCALGHPIALDAMQFAGEPGGGGYAPQHSPYAQPQQAPQGYGAPQPGAGSPFDAPRPAPQPGFAGAQPYPPPPGHPGFGAPQQYAPQPMFQPAPFPPQAGQYAPPPPPAYDPSAFAPTGMPATSRVLRGFLVSFQSNPAGEFWPLFTGRTAIGRANAAEPAEIALADATISSRHAALFVDGTVAILEDTASTNGTYVNEEHIGQNGRREIRDGDRIRLGGYTTLVKLLGRIG